MIEVDTLIKGRTLDIYGGNISLAKSLHKLGSKKINLYLREPLPSSNSNLEEGVLMGQYITASAAAGSGADVCLLDGPPLKVLAVGYPSDPIFVLARLRIHPSWGLGLLGLLRRALFGWLKIKGVTCIKDENGEKSHWLIIERAGELAKKERLFVPSGKGVEKFLNWLRKENVNYVVLRFFKQLPNLHREGGDLDLLIADEDFIKVEAYIKSQMSLPDSGTVASGAPIGLHAIAPHGGIPYYPPKLSRQILTNSVEGPSGSKVPEPLDAFHSFVYHVLYHYKGYATGIPTSLAGKAEYPPDNDYGEIIQQQAKELGISIGKTMEELDQYMAEVNWRPRLDLLAKIAKKNAWVRDRFFSGAESKGSGLVALVLKERALERNLLNPILNHLRSTGVLVVRATVLSSEQKRRATDHVRGGNWVDSNGNTEGWLPAAIIVAIDPKCAHLPYSYAGEYERSRITDRKKILREMFDLPNSPSIVHSADTTEEAWEYIDECLSEELDVVQVEIKNALKTNFLDRLISRISPAWLLHSIRYSVRDWVIKKTHR